jgi:hypothetical protein
MRRGLPVLFLVAILAGAAAASAGRHPAPLKPALATPVDWSRLPGLQTGPPPWNDDSATLKARIRFLGLDRLPSEQLAYHIHAHLDIYVNGRRVTVPKYIGIHATGTFQGTFITQVHTHRPDGVIHVESAKRLAYQLGQFMGEWGVRLSASCLGSFPKSCTGLEWWVDGRRRGGDPARLVLRNHEEIVISIGTPPAHVPTTWPFVKNGF